MSKETINVKSNGIRNELKEIRKSIDALTKAIIASNNRTYENNYSKRKRRPNDELRNPSNILD
jgi:hypothetical protein